MERSTVVELLSTCHMVLDAGSGETHRWLSSYADDPHHNVKRFSLFTYLLSVSSTGTECRDFAVWFYHPNLSPYNSVLCLQAAGLQEIAVPEYASMDGWIDG